MKISGRRGSALTRPGRAANWILALASACTGACGSGGDSTALNDAQTAVEPALATGGSSGAGSAPAPGSIVFRSDRDRAGIADLYVMSPDGGDVQRLTTAGSYSTPFWSPDGASIAFRQLVGLDAALGLTSSSGESPVILVSDQDPELMEFNLGWSGDELIYASHETGPDTDLRVVSRSGGQRGYLFSMRSGRRYQASVSSVDGHIAFSWSPEDTRSTGFVAGQDLWLATGPDDPAPENLTQGRVYAPLDPRWSPDGTKIVFEGFALLPDGSVEGLGSHSDGSIPPDIELYLFDLSTHELTRLTDNGSDDQNATWTPDGKSLIFMSNRDGDEDIWRMPVEAPEQAVDLIDDASAPSSDTMPDCFWGLPPQ